jgi:protein-histidine N-methyltransferase
LPSLAVFSQAARGSPTATGAPLSIVVADYNPSVLQLATMPNFILAWALAQRDACEALKNAFDMEDELELVPEVVEAFKDFLEKRRISLTFLSGGWSPEFITLLYDEAPDLDTPRNTLVLGAETIYSPFALESFTETIFRIMTQEKTHDDSVCETIVAAKKLYFGVGGSLDDFIDKSKAKGATIRQLMEETQGVWRGVVSCAL